LQADRSFPKPSQLGRLFLLRQIFYCAKTIPQPDHAPAGHDCLTLLTAIAIFTGLQSELSCLAKTGLGGFAGLLGFRARPIRAESADPLCLVGFAPARLRRPIAGGRRWCAVSRVFVQGAERATRRPFYNSARKSGNRQFVPKNCPAKELPLTVRHSPGTGLRCWAAPRRVTAAESGPVGSGRVRHAGRHWTDNSKPLASIG
jgi:hypothetical protein